MSWPPCEEDFKNIALSALEKSNDVNVHVLVYWENDPNLMIFNPVIYAKTDYQSLTKSLKEYFGFQSNSFLAFVLSPNNSSTSAGRKYFSETNINSFPVLTS
jgi:hypothetical protein